MARVIPPRLVGRVKRAACRLLGHSPTIGSVTSNAAGVLAEWEVCSRCGRLLRWEEVPTHV